MAKNITTLEVTSNNQDLTIYNSFSAAYEELGDILKTFSYTTKTKKVVDIQFGTGLCYVLTDDGRIWQYNLSTTSPSGSTKWQVIASNVRQFSACGYNILYVDNYNNVYAKGSRADGMVGISSGINSGSLANFTSTASGAQYVCCGNNRIFYIKTDGSLYGSGNQKFNALANGKNSDTPAYSWTAVTYPEAGVKYITTGYASISYCIDNNDDLWVTGCSAYGLRGNGDTNSYNYSRQWEYVASNVKKVCTGGNVAWYLTKDGYVYCAGKGIHADAKVTTARTAFKQCAEDVQDIFVACVADSNVTGLFVKNNQLYAIGTASNGAFGGNTTAKTYTTPTVIANNVEKAAGHKQATVYMTPSGSLYIAGRLDNSAVNNTVFVAHTPNLYVWTEGSQEVDLKDYGIMIEGIANAGDKLYLKFMTVPPPFATTLSVTCSNTDVKITNNYDDYRTVPGKIITNFTYQEALHTAKHVYLNSQQLAYIDAYGALWFLGTFQYGTAGAGTTGAVVYDEPTKIAANIKEFSCWGSDACYITNDGDLYVAGRNYNGQLAQGHAHSIGTYTCIAHNVRNAIMGSCLLYVTNNNELYTCGYNGYGQLGVGTSTDIYTPQKVAENVKNIYGGRNTNGYTDWDDVLYLAGHNYSGQQGNGATVQQDTTNVLTFTRRASNVRSAHMASNQTYIVTNNNELFACGRRDNNRLLNGVTTAGYVTTFTKMRSDVKTMHVTEQNVYIVLTNNDLYINGSNANGQYGNGQTTPNSLSAGSTLCLVAQNVDSVGTHHYYDMDGHLYLCAYNAYQQISHFLQTAQTFNLRATRVAQLPESNVPWTDVSKYAPAFVDEEQNLLDLDAYGIDLQGDIQPGDTITLTFNTRRQTATGLDIAHGDRVGFRFMTSEQYDNLFQQEAITGNLIYCLTDTKTIMLQHAAYTMNSSFVDEYPENPTQGIIYVNNKGGVRTWNGTSWNIIVPDKVDVLDANTADENLLTAKAIRDFIDPLLNDGLVKNVTYDPAINCFTVEHLNGEIKELPLRNIVSAITYENGNLTFNKLGTNADVIVLPEENHLIDANYEHSILNLFLNDGTKVSVDLADLIDIYVGNETSSVDVKIENKEISANIKASSQNTRLVVNVDGIYVPADLVQTAGSTNSIDLSLENKELTGTVKLSSAQGNALQIKEDGLYTDRVDIDSYYNKENMDIALDAEKDQVEFDSEIILKVNPGVTHERHEVYNIEEVKITKAWQQMQ